jgi:hypothetical protein
MPPGLAIDEDQSIPFLLALYGQVDGLVGGVQKQLQDNQVLSALLNEEEARGPWTSAAVAAAEAVHLLLQVADMCGFKSVHLQSWQLVDCHVVGFPTSNLNS